MHNVFSGTLSCRFKQNRHGRLRSWRFVQNPQECLFSIYLWSNAPSGSFTSPMLTACTAASTRVPTPSLE